jgi:hypothetical protein
MVGGATVSFVPFAGGVVCPVVPPDHRQPGSLVPDDDLLAIHRNAELGAKASPDGGQVPRPLHLMGGHGMGANGHPRQAVGPAPDGLPPHQGQLPGIHPHGFRMVELGPGVEVAGQGPPAVSVRQGLDGLPVAGGEGLSAGARGLRGGAAPSEQGKDRQEDDLWGHHRAPHGVPPFRGWAHVVGPSGWPLLTRSLAPVPDRSIPMRMCPSPFPTEKPPGRGQRPGLGVVDRHVSPGGDHLGPSVASAPERAFGCPIPPGVGEATDLLRGLLRLGLRRPPSTSM